jgi:hypothetical protein
VAMVHCCILLFLHWHCCILRHSCSNLSLNHCCMTVCSNNHLWLFLL